jgi:hypothetical protein
MPVYHISNFDVSAVQIDLSSNVFADNTLLADYWLGIEVEFNSNGVIKSDADLNDMFKSVFSVDSETYVGTASAFRNQGGTRSNIAEDAINGTGAKESTNRKYRANSTRSSNTSVGTN